MLKGSLLRCQRSDLAEFRTHLRLYGCPCTCKNEKDPIKNKGPREVTRLFIDFLDAQGQLTQ